MLDAGVSREQLFFTSKVPPKEINYEVGYSCYVLTRLAC